jgi:murein DD-endopeptidase MepM/ murein hydrolase activator NlpD
MRLRTDVPSHFGVIPQRSAGIHQGADYVAFRGLSLVTAADEGVVDNVGTTGSGDYGYFVRLRHSNAAGEAASYTLYAHLAGPPNVGSGQAVGAGQVMGAAGNSGNAGNTPTHVHFEIQTRALPRGGLQDREDPVRAFTSRPAFDLFRSP